MRRLLLLLLLIGAIPASAPAEAATVEFAEQCDRAGCFDRRIVLRAAPGERNLVSVTGADTRVRVRDEGALVAAGPGCEAVDAHEVVCGAAAGFVFEARLGDGDDVVDASAARMADRLYGGPGADSLTGGASGAFLDGGGGTDVLRGGEGDDGFGDGDGEAGDIDGDVLDGGAGTDLVYYFDRRTGVRVDVADGLPDGATGEGDRLEGIDGVFGGRGDDHLAGSDQGAAMDGGPGRDVIRARGGDDVVEAEARDRVDLGAGDDRLTSVRGLFLKGGIVRCGPGDDSVGYLGDGWTLGGCERLSRNEPISGYRPVFAGGVALVLDEFVCLLETRDCTLQVRITDRAGRVLGQGAPRMRGGRLQNRVVRLNALGRRSSVRRVVAVEFRRRNGRTATRRERVRIALPAARHP